MIEKSKNYWHQIPPTLRWIIIFIVPSVFFSFIFFGSPIKIHTIPIPEDLNNISISLTAEGSASQLTESVLKIDDSALFHILCLHNFNEVSVNDLKIDLPFEKDPETGAMEMTVIRDDGSIKHVYAKPESYSCGILFALENISQSKIEIRKPKPESIPAIVKEMQTNEKGETSIILGLKAYVNTDKSHLTDIIIDLRYLIVFWFWLVFVININQS